MFGNIVARARRSNRDKTEKFFPSVLPNIVLILNPTLESPPLVESASSFFESEETTFSIPFASIAI